MDEPTIYDGLLARGTSRREFLRLCGGLVALMGLPRVLPVPGMPAAAARRDDLVGTVARALQSQPRLPVIWLAAQDCAGCTEALLRSREPTILALLRDVLSLEYHETLSAATGHDAEAQRASAIERFQGRYVLVVEGSIPDLGAYCAVGGRSVRDLVTEAAAGAAAIVATGNCAAFGGLPAAQPNPTGAHSLSEVLPGKPVLNIPGCPAIPEVTAGSLAYYVTFGQLPELDDLGRPLTFYGQTVHSGCPRRPYFLEGKYAASFDDEGARQGWCLLELGCRGPETYNSCSTRKWGPGLSFPVQSGHPCLGCSEPNFWDNGSFYPWQPRPGDVFLPFAGSGR